MTKKETTECLANAFNNGLWSRIFIELIYSNSGVCRVYLAGDATDICAGGYGYDKNGCCVGKIGLLFNTEDEEYIKAMKYSISGGGDMAGLIDRMANKLTEMHKTKYIGVYQNSKEGYTIAFIKLA